ncbi:MAG: hypothetical protein JNK02_11000 [Planctomycetes bacterium]|nr:hypothetical protein [Planctomycetota bacterium]
MQALGGHDPNGGDINCVDRQLTQLSIDIATYDFVVQAIRYQPDRPAARLRSPLLQEFISRGFATIAATALRRQVDRYHPSDPEKGVYCLNSVLEDMQKHCKLLTRARILAAENLPYDDEMEERRFTDSWPTAPAGFTTTSDPVWLKSRHRHEALDQLTGTSAVSRTEGDSIRGELFQAACEELRQRCSVAKTVVDKYVAHAATKASRDHGGQPSAVLSMDKIRLAHETCCRITKFLLVDVLGGSCAGFMPYFQYDHLEHLELLVADRADLSRMRADWESYRQRLDTLEPWSPPPPQGSEHGDAGQAE